MENSSIIQMIKINSSNKKIKLEIKEVGTHQITKKERDGDK